MAEEKSTAQTQTHPRELLTLAYIRRDDQLLLGWKKRGFGKQLWNGFGGKVEPGEDVTSAAVREIREECGLAITPSDMQKFAVFEFEFKGDPIIREAHAYICSVFTGELEESSEMRPMWFPVDKLPFDRMWKDNRLWFGWLLDGVRFRGRILFDERRDTVLSYRFTQYSDVDKVLLEGGGL